MPRYDIQFQKGLSLREFMARYGTEDQCLQAICNARWPQGFDCPECGSTRHCWLSRGLFQCQDCRKQTSPTAGTIFQSTKLPLTVWLNEAAARRGTVVQAGRSKKTASAEG